MRVQWKVGVNLWTSRAAKGVMLPALPGAAAAIRGQIASCRLHHGRIPIMTKPDTRYQKYLARKQQKLQGHKTMPAHLRASMLWQMGWVARAPIHECFVPASGFEQGLGNLVFSRALPDGHMALSVFLLDTFCLGVKNALFKIGTRLEYDAFLSRVSPSQGLEPTGPPCFRKLVEGGVAYARGLGFHPHADYAEARQIFGDVDAAACPTHFE